MWEIIKGIIIAIIAIPFIIWGIQIILSVILGGAVGGLSLFGAIWDKQQPLSWKDGIGAGLVYTLFIVILDIILCSFIIFTGGFASLVFFTNLTLIFIAWIVALVALIRTKFKFAASFLVTHTICYYITGTIVSLLFNLY